MIRRSVYDRAAQPSPTKVTSGATAGTNWSITNFNAWIIGDWVQFRVTVSRTTSAITQTASGDVANETVATLPASCRGNINLNLNCPGNGNSGRSAGGAFNPSTGAVDVTSLSGTSNLAIGEALTFGGVFLVNE